MLCLDLELNVTEIKNNINPTMLTLEFESYAKGDGHNRMFKYHGINNGALQE